MHAYEIFLHLLLKLQFLLLIEFVIVWFSFRTFFFLSSEFLKITFLICWWKITGKILQGLVSPSLAKKCNIFHELHAFKDMSRVWSIVPVLRGFLQHKDGNWICKILNIKPMIWEFPISKTQKWWKIKNKTKKKRTKWTKKITTTNNKKHSSKSTSQQQDDGWTKCRLLFYLHRTHLLL